MGVLYRLLAPRPVRRLRHPFRRALPRSVRRASFAAWSVRHPLRRVEVGVRSSLYGEKRRKR